MTDERSGAALWPALRRLPPGSGIVFRHHATPRIERHRLFVKVRRIARARRLTIVTARTPMPGGDGVHAGKGRGLRTWPAHDRRQALRGCTARVDALFVSPVFATRSHPGRPGIGIAGALRIAGNLRIPTIALGGMTPARWRRQQRFGFHGWAAIEAWNGVRKGRG